MRVKKKCIHSVSCDRIVFALRALLFICIIVVRQIFRFLDAQSHGWLHWMTESYVGSSIPRPLLCILCFFGCPLVVVEQVVASYLQWYPFVFQQSSNLSLRPKNLLLAFLLGSVVVWNMCHKICSQLKLPFHLLLLLLLSKNIRDNVSEMIVLSILSGLV